MRGVKWKRSVQLLSILLCTFIYNEFVVYYLVLARCDWPGLQEQVNSEGIHAMFLSDPHLLGPTGHWWDRLRREWQMQRTFQTSLQLLNPELVFILGDLFDDGKWSSDEAFQKDVTRFHKMFAHSDTVKLLSVMGNHDVGFHYMIDSHKLDRFVKAVNSSDSVTHFRYKNLSFVTANSMAFEGDDCTMCSRAEKDLANLSSQLQCAKKNWTKSPSCEIYTDKFTYTAPILLQHFPMYRESDGACEGIDATPEEYKYDKFKVKYDCLSPEASLKLMTEVKPRLIISGHTHYFCQREHENGVQEWSVPSFSWRNIRGPSFLLVTLTASDYRISKCYMPNEYTVHLVYGSVIGLEIIYLVYKLIQCIFALPSRSKIK